MDRRSKTIAKLVLATGLLAAALRPAIPATSNQKEAGLKKYFFWKAMSGSHTLYLLGSIHFATNRIYPLPADVENAFKTSSVLILEANFSEAHNPDMMQEIVPQGISQNENELWMHLDPKTTKQFKEFCNAHHLSLTTVGHMKPWLASFLISSAKTPKSAATGDFGIDNHFSDLAKGKKTIVGIETVQNQFKLITEVPDDIAVLSIKSILNAGPFDKDGDRKLEDLWLSGDTKAFSKVFLASEVTTPKRVRDWQEASNQKRNLKMADCAESHLKTESITFMIVGTEHLALDGGVVDILRKSGYKVEQLSVR